MILSFGFENGADLVKRYQDRKQILEAEDPNRRNLSVRASFDLSYEALSDEHKERWRRLAVFPADFDISGAAAVWDVANIEETAKPALQHLVKKNLPEVDSETKRFRLHDRARVLR